MSVNADATKPAWDDDDLPEWTDEMFDHAQLAIGDKVVRPATGVLTNDGVKRTAPFTVRVPGRPPERERTKRQVTVRLDADLLERLRASGPGWQSRLNATLREAAGI